MTSTVAVIVDLDWEPNGGSVVDLQDWPRIFTELKEGGPFASAEARGADRRTPYRDGQVYGPRRNDRLPISLMGWVAGEGDTEAEQRSDTATGLLELKAAFDVTIGQGTLRCRTPDGTLWSIWCYPEVFLPDAYPDIPSRWGFQVRLIAIDPPEWEAEAS